MSRKVWLVWVICEFGCAAGARGESDEPGGSQAVASQSDPAPENATAEPAKPCTAPEHRQFDFWVGEWEVHKPDGTLAGHNRIEPILGGCVLRETYASAAYPYEGTSLNIYDAGTGRWHQTWVDNGGLLLELNGGMEGNRMVMRGATKGPKGEMLHEIAWQLQHDGRVEQRWRSSTDGGHSWKDVFVGLYRRVASP